MSALNKKYKIVLEELKQNISDPKEYELVKTKISELTITYLKSLDQLLDFKENEDAFKDKLDEIEKRLTAMETDLYVNKGAVISELIEDDYEFEITCPFCDFKFITDNSTVGLKEIRCPHCHLVIELDWSDEEKEEEAKDSKPSNKDTEQTDTKKAENINNVVTVKDESESYKTETSQIKEKLQNQDKVEHMNEAREDGNINQNKKQNDNNSNVPNEDDM